MSSDYSECCISECGSEFCEADSGYTSDVLQSSLTSINSTDVQDTLTPPPVPDHGTRCRESYREPANIRREESYREANNHHHREVEQSAPAASTSACESEKRLSLDSSLKSLGINVDEKSGKEKNRGMSAFGKQLGKKLARKITKTPSQDAMQGLQYAVTTQDYEMLQKLLNTPEAADLVNVLHPPGVAVLHQACVLGNFNIVKLLLQKGADVNLKTWRNLSPTKLAAICGHYDVAQLLLLCGGDVRDVMCGHQ